MARANLIESEKSNARLVEGAFMFSAMWDVIRTGRESLAGTTLLHELHEGLPISENGVSDAYAMLREVAKFAHPNAYPSFWEHQFAAPRLGREIAQQLKNNGTNINPNEIEVTLIIHDLARLVIPHRYGFNDTVNHHMLIRIDKGLARLLDNMVPIGRVLSGTIKPEDVTIAQMITDVADNLGKRTEDGQLFTSSSWEDYLNVHTNHYNKVNAAHWLTEKDRLRKLPEGIEHQRTLVRHSLSWLSKQGVDIDKALAATVPVAPRILYIVRHGDTDDGGNLYNWDEDTPEPVGLSPLGYEQIKKLGEVMAKRRVSPHAIHSSDLLRARQSTEILGATIMKNQKLSGIPVEHRSRLRDTRAGAAVRAFSTKAAFKEQTGGNVYTPDLVRRGVEPIYNVQNRFIGEVERVLSLVHDNGSLHRIIVAHGDPIRFIIAWLDNPNNELTADDYASLAAQHYIGKGEGWEIIFDPEGNYLTRHRLPDPYKVAERDY